MAAALAALEGALPPHRHLSVHQPSLPHCVRQLIWLDDFILKSISSREVLCMRCVGPTA